MNSPGYLHIIMGPMFSGKTSRLIKIFEENQNRKIFSINHVLDKRYSSNEIVSHDGKKVRCYSFKKIREIYENFDEFEKSDIILINEAQFFEDLFELVIIMVEKYGKRVYLCGLDGDYEQKEIGEMLKLIPRCDSVEKLRGKCHYCSNESIFSKRITEQREQVVVGNDNYVPCCRKCY